MTKLFSVAKCAVPENIHTPPQKGLEFPGGGGVCKAKKFKEMYGISTGVDEGSYNSFRGGGMDIFWNYTMR